MAQLIYLEPDLPKVTDKFWDGFARMVVKKLEYWRHARFDIERMWEECDRAYLCYRQLPELESMPYLDSSDFGETDIYDGVNNLAINLTLAVMPKDESWLTLIPQTPEPAQITKAARAEQVWMHRQAKSRRIIARSLKQMIVRGTTHLFLRWDQVYSYRLLGTRNGRRKLAAHLKKTGASPEIAAQIKQVRERFVQFNGPAPRVVDDYDVFMDPETDILCDRKPSFILRMYMRPFELKNLKDEAGENVYDNLKDLMPQKAGDQYMNSVDGDRRVRSNRILGVSPWNAEYSAEVVPVYVYYSAYEEFEGYEFYDTYFYVAIGHDSQPRLIRIEENPAINGHPLLLTDTFVDWFTNFSYGISSVEKTLAAWHQKNFLNAVMVNAAAASQFPALLVAGGALKEDILKMEPGAINEIALSALGMEIIKPIPMNYPSMMQLSFQDMQYLKEKISGTFETTGAYQQKQGATPGNRETATSVNFRATQQGTSIDEFAEKIGDTIQQYCQWAYDMRQQTAEADAVNPDGQPILTYGVIDSGTFKPGELVFDEWRRPRNVEVLGLHGIVNKQQNIQNNNEFLGMLAQAAQALPNAPAVVQDVVKALAQQLEIETQDSSWQTNQEIAANDPQVQMQALQSALQNPQLLMQIPGIQQLLMQDLQALGGGQPPGGNNGNGKQPHTAPGGQAPKQPLG